MAATATIKLNHNTQEYRTDGPVQRRSLGHVQVYNALTPGEEGQHQRRVHVRTALGSGLGRRRHFRAFGATGSR
jgi:hypothetical protein